MSNIILIKIISFLIIEQIINSFPVTNSNNQNPTDKSVKLDLLEIANLIFNDNNKWQFDIKYKYTSENINEITKYNISILYNEKPSLASCTNNIKNSTLNCLVEKVNQSKHDKVKINILDLPADELTNKSPKLRKLEQIELTYIKSFELKYSSYYWTFKIEILENTLQENQQVVIDIYRNTIMDTANCTYSNSILSCKLNTKGYNTNILSISSQKESGTVLWKNLKEKAIIPFDVEMTYSSAFELELIDNKWKFILQGTSSSTVYSNFLLTINMIIKNNGEEENAIANCISNNSNLYKCEFETKNPDKNSLVFISNSKEGVSVTWKNALKYNGQVNRFATLHFIDAYELFFSTANKRWEFKIDIEDDDLPDQILFTTDVLYDNSKGVSYCTNNKKVLNCSLELNYADKLVRLYGTKYKGSITWINLNELEKKIPLNLKMTFSNAYGLLFAGKWNFIVDAVNIDKVPPYSLAFIDIVQNSVETTAICEILGGNAKLISNITCVSELDVQSENDNIKLNNNKKYGTIEWSQDLNEEQKIIKLPENKAISLKFFNAYDLSFLNNKWFFYILANSTKLEKVGDLYTLEILYTSNNGAIDSTASCELREGMKVKTKILLICVCNEQSQNENDVVKLKYPQTSLSTLTWTSGITDHYDIILKTSLTLVKAYNLELNSQVWTFNIEVKDGILPAGSKVSIDIIRSTSEIANCTAVNNNLLSCASSKSSSSVIIHLSSAKSAKSSVIWKQNLEQDYKIYYNVVLEYKSAKNLHFNETDKKWYFMVGIMSGGKAYSKVSIGIIYENRFTIAKCIQDNNYFLNCVVEEKNQKKKDKVLLYNLNSAEASVTWKRTNFKDIITLERELTLSKTANLRYSPEDGKTWIFDVYILDEDVPEDSELEVDVVALKVNQNNISVTYYSTAFCTYSNKILSCEVTDTRYQGYLFSIRLKSNKIETSTSSVTKWNNVNTEEIPIPLDITLDYNYCTEVQLVNNKHIFYCRTHHESIPIRSESYVDISIDGYNTISHCFGLNYTFLKCEINEEEYTSSNIYLLKDKSDKSTITWNNLYIDQYLSPIKLDFFHAYDGQRGYLVEYTRLYIFKMLAHGKKLKENVNIGVQINQILDGKWNYRDTIQEMTLGCSQVNGILFCYWYSPSHNINPDMDLFYLILNKQGNQIEWTNPGNRFIQENEYPFTLNYTSLNYITFNNEKKCFEFSFNGEGNYNSSSKLVLDLFVSNGRRHAFCIPKTGHEIFCYSEVNYLYKPEHILKIRIEREFGNVIWDNIYNDEIILNSGDYIIIEISKIFDLKFDSNIWKFKIKPKANSQFSGTKTLGVLFGENNVLANCRIVNSLLECQINSGNQYNSQLVKLLKINDYKGNIQIINFENDGIPFNINLEFIKAYDLEYDYMDNEEWSFKVDVKNLYNSIIPSGSTFSMDIKVDKNNDELAFCIQEGGPNNNIITLLCKPQNKVEVNSLIKLNKNKSIYSSITWTNSDFDENIIINAKINVLNLNNLGYNKTSNISTFNMEFCFPNLPIDGIVLIDLNYNHLEMTGTCQIISQYIFKCYPNIGNQKEDDIFEIIYAKKLGTVNYINKPDKLKFSVKEVDIITEKIPETEEIIIVTDKATEKVTEKITEKPTEEITEKITEKVTEKITEEPTEEVTEKVTEKITEKPTEEITEKVTEKITEKPTEEITEKVTEKITEEPTEEVTEKVTEKPTEKITEKITEEIKPTIEPENLIPTFIFEKAYDLKFNKKWTFKIKVSESNINNGNSVMIDMKIDDIYDSKANCIINDYILSCELNYQAQNLYNDIQLINKQSNKNLKWINLPDKLDMYMSYEINFINIYGGFYNNKWRFNILYEPKNKIQKIYDKFVLLDIIVNYQPSTAICEITLTSFLKCVSNHDYQNKNDDIKIAGNVNPNLGTVYLDRNLDYGETIIRPISLSINYESSMGYKNKNKFEFIIMGYIKDQIIYEVGDETITQIEIKKNNSDIKEEISCLTNNIIKEKDSFVYITCILEENSSLIDGVTINMEKNGLSKYVKFNPVGNFWIKNINKK